MYNMGETPMYKGVEVDCIEGVESIQFVTLGDMSVTFERNMIGF